MVADLAGVRLQLDRPRLFVDRLLRVEERLERRLRVDDDLLAAGKVDDHVGAQPAVVGLQMLLLVEITALEHAGDLDDAAQLHFAPASSDDRRAERARERAGGGAERDDLLGQPRIGGDAVALRLAQPRVNLLQRVGDRLVVALERGLGEIEEGRAIVLERLGGERLEGVAQPRVGLVQQLLRGGERQLVALDLVAKHGGARLGKLSCADCARHEHGEAGGNQHGGGREDVVHSGSLGGRVNTANAVTHDNPVAAPDPESVRVTKPRIWQTDL